METQEKKSELKIYEQGCEQFGLASIIFGNLAMLVWIGLVMALLRHEYSIICEESMQ